jgi:hypothetical protein
MILSENPHFVCFMLQKQRHDNPHNNIQHNDTQHKEFIIIKFYNINYKEFYNIFYADCCILFTFMLSVIMLKVVMLSVVMLSVFMLSVVMLNVIMLSVVAPLKVRAHSWPQPQIID